MKVDNLSNYTIKTKEAVNEFAENMEAQFLEILLEKMEQGIMREENLGPTADYYRSMIRKEHAKGISKKENFGIKEAIIKEITSWNDGKIR